ncbi:hypothetical protein D3C72_2231280 [compost metagenome]
MRVPLKSMCSMKWEMPLFSAVSFLEPVSTQNPTEAERTWGISSSKTLTPLGSTCFCSIPFPQGRMA